MQPQEEQVWAGSCPNPALSKANSNGWKLKIDLGRSSWRSREAVSTSGLLHFGNYFGLFLFLSTQ
jgi:hypothetical protein